MKRYEACRGAIGWLFAALIVTGCTPAANQQPQVKLPAIERAEGGGAGVGTGVPIDVRLDTSAQATDSSRSQELTTLFNAAYLDKDNFQRHDSILVRWPVQLARSGELVIRIQTASGRIYLEKQFTAQADAVADLGKAYLIPAGDYEIVLMPSLGEYYFGDVRLQHKMAITLSP